MLFNIDLKPKESPAAIDDQGNKITYGQLTNSCEIFANILQRRELVFCLCENTVGSLLGYISLYENKDVALLLSATIDRELLMKLISIYKPSFLWIPEKYLNDFQVKIIYKSYGYVLGKLENEIYPMNNNLSLLLTTSGSTGSPKLVRHKYGNIESSARIVANIFEWTSKERAICILPMQYSMGLNVINSHLYSGGMVLLVSNSMTSPKFWEFVKKNRSTSFTGVPFSYEILMRLKFMRMNLPYLETLAEGGGKLPDTIFKAFAEYAENKGKRFIATFGTTETSARMSYLKSELAISKTGSIGNAIPEGEMFLIDDLTNIIETQDTEGELCYKGPNVTMGYAICKKDLMLGDEFCGKYRTGDIARRDADGYYYIVGRKKRFLKLFGLRISLDQCERLISEKFNIECACTGDDKRMQIFVTIENLKSEIKEYIILKTGLVSTSFNVNAIENIPRSGSGKINYGKLLN